MFAAVALAGAIARGLRQSVIPFYIVSGILLNPFVAGELTEAVLGQEFAVGLSAEATHFIELGAELGIVFLLFFLGLEFNLDRLLASRDRIGTVGLIDLVINFGVGFVLGFLLFGDVLAAFIIAGMVYISSSAIITKSLIDLGWIANEESSPLLGTLVFEDLFIAVYLAVLSALVAGAGDVTEAAFSVGLGLGFILVLLILVYAGTALFTALIETESNEFIALRVTGVTVLVAGAALTLGVSEAVAAFFIGMAFSGTGRAEKLENLLEPVRDIFAAVFFFWIGLVTDPMLFAGVLGIIATAVVVTTPTKLLSGFWSGKVYDLDDRRSTRVALGMVTRGEFTLIIASTVLVVRDRGGAITAATANEINAFAVGYVLVMSILGTVLMQYSAVFETRLTAWRNGE
ncbi:cation:proton antiporter [Halobacteriaceae archaeon SHR40]|uniref:cation:proton antiporter n=1 Tax=Halovenus amylolytica TaxID=2500550 RepID=UPI000FE38EEA